MDDDKQQWLSIAAVVLVIGGLGFFLYRRSRQESVEPTALGEGVAIEEKASELLNKMNFEVPEGADRANLGDVSGGDGTGVATESYEEGRFTHSMIAALPDPEAGMFYEGWLVREDPFDLVYTGKFEMAKGGWMLDYTSEVDLSDHNQVVVTLEAVDDQKPEKHILEGKFE